MSDYDFDIAIIGGGIVGTALAMRCRQSFSKAKVCLIEKEASLAHHQSGHNSGVIHRGIYYKKGSLKASLCAEGIRKLLEFADKENIPYKLSGKIILAATSEEVEILKALWDASKDNAITDLEWCDEKRICSIEPHAKGLEAIYSPKTGVIDFKAVTHAMGRVFLKEGGSVYLSCELKRMVYQERRWILETSRGAYKVRYLLNCAGLYADRISRLAGIDPEIRIVPFRGEYYLLKEEKNVLVKSLIYPVPDPRFPFLGVHFTRTVADEVKAGPNAVLALSRQAYSKWDYDLCEFSLLLGFAGFWKMSLRYRNEGLEEMRRSWSKKVFTRNLQKLMPGIASNDLIPGPTGVRAQCVDRQGNLVNDFKIVEGAHSLHVLNVPSPAATASLAIADYVLNHYPVFGK